MNVVVVVIIIALVVGAIGGGLMLAFGHRLKGSIELALQGSGGGQYFEPGQPIQGIMTVRAKKDLGPGRLFVALVCTEEWSEWTTDSDGDRSRERRTRELFRHDVNVEPRFSIGKGDTQTAPFVLPTPPVSDAANQESSMPGWVQAMVDVVGSLSRDDRETYWEVTGQFDIPGLDLIKRERIPLQYPARF